VPAVTVVSAVLWLVVALGLAHAGRSAAGRRRHALVLNRTLGTLSAVAEFRGGLGDEGARRLRALFDVPAVVLADPERVLGSAGEVAHGHLGDTVRLAAAALAAGWSKRPSPQPVACAHPACPVRWAVTAPLKIDGEVRAVLAVYSATRSPALAGIVPAVAGWASDQLELGESERLGILGKDPPLLVVPDPVPAVFVSRSLNVVGELARTAPERAAELVRELADFLRYRSRQYGEYAELAEEVRCVDQFLVLAREQFGDRLTAVLDIAPEVLPVKVPFLCLQPLVERIVAHGPGPRGWRLAIAVTDCHPDVVLSVEHEDPRIAYGEVPRGTPNRPYWRSHQLGYRGVSGLPAVARRMRHLYGDDYAIEVDVRAETSTKITLRLPKG
jgi:two-component system LytT family sensor kinase